MALEDAMRLAEMWDNDAPPTDISQPLHEVEIRLEQSGNNVSLWVNVEGRCRLRITRIPKNIVQLRDHRKSVFDD